VTDTDLRNTQTSEPQPGSYGVVKTRGFYAWLIRVGTRSEFDHAFIVCDTSTIIEAEPSGARWGQLSEYLNDRTLFNTGEPMTDEQRKAVVAEAVTLLNTPYGWTDIVRLGLRTLGIQWGWLTRRADNEKAMVCSQIVSRCGEAAGLDWLCGRESPAAVTPADLAQRITAQSWPVSHPRDPAPS
jgi:uncharacterized protein YycO